MRHEQLKGHALKNTDIEFNLRWKSSIFFVRRINCLAEEIIWENLIVVETQRDVAAIGRGVIGFEKIVPQAERQAEIDSVFVGQFFGVVPDVHLRVVENIFERAQRDLDVGVGEMAYRKREQIDDDVILNAKTD